MSQNKWYLDGVYHLMCAKATKLQKDWDPSRGDMILHRSVPACGLSTSDDMSATHEVRLLTFRTTPNVEEAKKHYKSKSIWLPNQSQLQEIATNHNREYFDCSPVYIHNYLECGIRRPSGYIKYYEYLKSMEQLWLAFVMAKLYNKMWNGEDWVDFDWEGELQ